LLYGLSPHSSYSEKLQLTLAGLSRCESAAADADLFVAVLGYLVRRRREFVPTAPSVDEHLSSTSTEVRENVAIAAASPPGSVERLYDVFMQDPYASHGGGKAPDGSWIINVGPEIRRYRGVQTVRDYLARRQPSATVEDQAPLPAPRRLGAITNLARRALNSSSPSSSEIPDKF
jgi:hypothetical protein